jgi:NADPH:quinone reductase
MTMDAIQISRAGSPEVLQCISCPVPRPSRGEILVRTVYAGVNRHDCNQRAAGRHPNQRLPANIPGLEVAGEVISCGEAVTRFVPGDFVCALADGGGYAQACIVDEALAMRWPRESAREGAALPEALFTSWYNLVDLARLQAGETLLIHGGTSGVGIMATQLAARLGARVWTTCGTDEKCAISREFGASRTFNYRSGDFAAALQAAAPEGIDVILDLSGLRYFNLNLKLAAERGRVVYLSSAGASGPIESGAFMARQVWSTSSRLRPLPGAQKARLAADMTRASWLDVASMRILIDSEFPLAEAARAHERMESGTHAGKIVLAVGHRSQDAGLHPTLSARPQP